MQRADSVQSTQAGAWTKDILQRKMIHLQSPNNCFITALAQYLPFN